MKPFRQKILVAILFLASFVCLSLADFAFAGPITNGYGNAPFSRLSVYRGVVSIQPVGGGQGVLELGYRGEEIAATQDIYFRPGSTTQADGIRVCTNCGTGVNATYANLVVTGNVCLYGPTGTVADCRAVWPGAGGPGTSSWDYVTDTGIGGTPGIKFVQPNSANATRAVHIGSAASPVGGIALDIDAYDGVVVRNANNAAKAVSVQGNAMFFDATVTGAVRVNGQPVYDTVNSGAGSGLDADTLYANDVTLEPAASCTDTGGYPRIGCLCFLVKEGPTMVKKCTALANRPY